MSHALQDGEGLGGDDVSQLLFDLHRELDRVQGVESVLLEGAVNGEGSSVGGSEVVSEQLDHESIKIRVGWLALKSWIPTPQKHV